MKRGVPPTAVKARTGEFTPPGMTAQASSNRAAEVLTAAAAWSVLPMTTSVPACSRRSTTGCKSWLRHNRLVTRETAVELALARVAAARDDPDTRLALMRELYQVPTSVDRGHLPFRQAASAFMGWQLRRGLLNAPDGSAPGSPWWRAVNERLLRDGWEARALAFGHPGTPSSPAVAASLEFIRHPSARRWYRAHNISVVSAYLDHQHLASRESRVERFFMNVVLARVLYAHALVAAPRLALGWRGFRRPAARRPTIGHDRDISVAFPGAPRPLSARR